MRKALLYLAEASDSINNLLYRVSEMQRRSSALGTSSTSSASLWPPSTLDLSRYHSASALDSVSKHPSEPAGCLLSCMHLWISLLLSNIALGCSALVLLPSACYLHVSLSWLDHSCRHELSICRVGAIRLINVPDMEMGMLRRASMALAGTWLPSLRWSGVARLMASCGSSRSCLTLTMCSTLELFSIR